MTFINIFTTAVNLFALILILDFLRREKLKEKFSIVWILAIVLLQLLIVFEGGLTGLANLVGVYYPPSLLFYLAIVFLFIICLHLSMTVSKLTKQNQILAQRLSLLQARVESLALARDGQTALLPGGAKSGGGQAD